MTTQRFKCSTCECELDDRPTGKFCGVCGHSAEAHESAAVDTDTSDEVTEQIDVVANPDEREEEAGETGDDDDSVSGTPGHCRSCGCTEFAAPAGRRFCAACGHSAAEHGVAVEPVGGEVVEPSDARASGPRAVPPGSVAIRPIPSWIMPTTVAIASVILLLAVAVGIAGGWRGHRSSQLDAIHDRRVNHERDAKKAEARAENIDTELAQAQKDVRDAAANRVALRRDVQALPGRVSRLKAREAALKSTLRTADAYS